jgi:hypothetical protein
MIGFETIGNATVICFDDKPILATDPWIAGEPYFGSWGMAHEIPTAQLNHILQCDYIWLSHGHPDHTNPASLERLSNKTILLPDHVGNRMRNDLVQLGFSVQTLPDRAWRRLSKHIRVMSVADYNQDGILLIDINGRLLVNLNDAVDRGWGRFVRGIVRRYETTFLLKLFGYGDADMINIFTEGGKRLLPPPPTASEADLRFWNDLFLQKLTFWTSYFGTRYVIPFSMFHMYQRRDSLWAAPYTTPLEAFKCFKSAQCELLPAFIRYDCESDTLDSLNPPKRELCIREPEEFGDNWTDQLESDEVIRVVRYFKGIEFLRDHLDFINVRVGQTDHTISINCDMKLNRGVTFEVPRVSLMAAVKYNVFDDLLIGNFMKTTLHGRWGPGQAPNVLYPHFTPYVARYADNAGVKTKKALSEYLGAYRHRAPLDYMLHKIEGAGVQRLRTFVDPHSILFHVATKAYAFMKAW